MSVSYNKMFSYLHSQAGRAVIFVMAFVAAAALILIILYTKGTMFAGVPTTINYQGRYRENGVFITGTRAFKFRVTNNDATEIYWTSSIVDLTVEKGLFSYTINAYAADWAGSSPYLEVYVGPAGSGDAQLIQMSPREQFLAAAYTIYSTSAAYSTKTGVGDANYVAKFTATNVVGNSILYNDSTGVGLGTVSPNSKLEIVSGVTHAYPTMGLTYGSMTITPVGTADRSTSLTFRANNGGVLATGAQAGIYVQSSGSYGTKLYFGTTDNYTTGSQVRMFMDHLGKVGIGTTVPGDKLSLDGNLTLFGGGKVNIYTDAGSTLIGYYGGSRNGDASLISSSAGKWLRLGNMNSHISLWGNNGAETDDTPQFIVTTTTNVGIGVVSPVYRIASSGTTTTARTWTSRRNLFLIGYYNDGGTNACGISNNIYLNDSDAWINADGANQGAFLKLTNAGTLSMWGTKTAGGTDLTEMFRFTASSDLVSFPNGNVGFGNTDPAQKLDISGDLYLTSSTANTIFFGNIGVAAPGAGSAGEKIQIYGTAGTVGSDDCAIGIENNHMWFNTSGAFAWSEDGTERIRLNTTGLGIGTTHPDLKLDVNGYIGSWEYGATGGWKLGRWPTNASNNTYLYLSRGNTPLYQDLAIGGLYASGAQRYAPVDDAAEIVSVDPKDKYELGDVVIADPHRDLRVRKNMKAYDERVIGVISDHRTASLLLRGGSGINNPEDLLTSRIKKPMAIAGPVMVKVVLENGNIERGDFLTSSSTPGYAMKCPMGTKEQKLKAIGAIIGKAMEEFKADDKGKKTGLIPMILALQ